MTTMMMRTSQEGINFIKRKESFSAKAYKDPVGVWTIGYGTTNPEVAYEGNVIDRVEAERWLRIDLQEAEQAVSSKVKVPLSQGQFDALSSFVYNVGSGAFSKSTLLRKLNKKDYLGAANEFPRWVYAKGKKLGGLVKRRNDERKMFLAGTKLPEPVGPKESNISPEPPPKPSAVKNPGVQAAAGITGGGMFAQAAEQIEPLAWASEYILYAFIALSVAGLIYAWVGSRRET